MNGSGTLASDIRVERCISSTAGLVVRRASEYQGESVGQIHREDIASSFMLDGHEYDGLGHA